MAYVSRNAMLIPEVEAARVSKKTHLRTIAMRDLVTIFGEGIP